MFPTVLKKFIMGDSDMSDMNFSDDEGFSGHEKILLEKHRSKLGKKAGIREVYPCVFSYLCVYIP